MTSSPNEWYRWERDLRQNPDIDILFSIDPSSVPLGTGPTPQEIWPEGDYTVAWTNRKYRMVYLNMGHDDIVYEHTIDTTNRALSHTFGNPVQDRLVLAALLWLGEEGQTSRDTPSRETPWTARPSRSWTAEDGCVVA